MFISNYHLISRLQRTGCLLCWFRFVGTGTSGPTFATSITTRTTNLKSEVLTVGSDNRRTEETSMTPFQKRGNSKNKTLLLS